MFKSSILVVIIVLICMVNSLPLENSSLIISNDLNETTTVFTTTTTTTNTIRITSTESDLLLNKSIGTYKPAANFAQYNGKLLANQSTESSLNGRIINNNNNSVTAIPTNSLSLTLILVLIAVVTLVVSGIILSALFVMRRRFSIWRLNGNNNGESKEIPTSDEPTAGATCATKEDVKEETCALKCDEINEKDPELAKKVMEAAATDSTAVPVSVNVDNGHSNEAATDLISNEKNESEQQQQQQQASPSSSSPLIENVNEEHEQPKVEQVTSSSSLIVNVLNELSESVACKLNDEDTSANVVDDATVVKADLVEPLNKEE
jgi:hypothetical protein